MGTLKLGIGQVGSIWFIFKSQGSAHIQHTYGAEEDIGEKGSHISLKKRFSASPFGKAESKRASFNQREHVGKPDKPRQAQASPGTVGSKLDEKGMTVSSSRGEPDHLLHHPGGTFLAKHTLFETSLLFQGHLRLEWEKNQPEVTRSKWTPICAAGFELGKAHCRVGRGGIVTQRLKVM